MSPKNRPEHPIGYEVKTLNNMIFRDMIASSARKGMDELTMMHGWILGYLYHNQEKDIFQKDLENEFCISKSTVTNIIKLMEKKGYITRESVSSDARLKKLSLTDTGLMMHQMQVEILDEQEQRLKEMISEEELKIFLHTIHTLRSKIKEGLENDSIKNKTEKNVGKESDPE